MKTQIIIGILIGILLCLIYIIRIQAYSNDMLSSIEYNQKIIAKQLKIDIINIEIGEK